MWSDADLYSRGAETLLASWEEYARGASDASVRRSPGVAAAVFPNEPERGVYNNALLRLELTPAERATALDAMEAAYAAAGVTRFAAWVHESDEGMRAHLERRGYALDTWTRAMGMTLDDIRLSRPNIELAPTDWLEYMRIIGGPPGFLRGADQAAFHVLIARLCGETVATAMAFDLAGDCGIYNVTDALARGCQTASLQATEMAEPVSASAGCRDLGRILEYVPQTPTTRGITTAPGI